MNEKQINIGTHAENGGVTKLKNVAAQKLAALRWKDHQKQTEEERKQKWNAYMREYNRKKREEAKLTES